MALMRLWMPLQLLALLFLAIPIQAWVTRPSLPRTSFLKHPSDLGASPSAKRTKPTLVMRDRSASYWFRAGDSVKVVEDVEYQRQSLKGRTGTVVETWEKCDVDPTCCCAEQVDPNMAVRVRFDENKTNTNEPSSSDNDKSSFFHYYFAEDELAKL